MGMNRQLPTGGTHAFSLLSSHVLWAEGGSSGRCCLHPLQSSSIVIPTPKGQLPRLTPPSVSAVLVCACLDVYQIMLHKVHVCFQQGVKELGCPCPQLLWPGISDRFSLFPGLCCRTFFCCLFLSHLMTLAVHFLTSRMFWQLFKLHVFKWFNDLNPEFFVRVF